MFRSIHGRRKSLFPEAHRRNPEIITAEERILTLSTTEGGEVTEHEDGPGIGFAWGDDRERFSLIVGHPSGYRMLRHIEDLGEEQDHSLRVSTYAYTLGGLTVVHHVTLTQDQLTSGVDAEKLITAAAVADKEMGLGVPDGSDRADLMRYLNPGTE